MEAAEGNETQAHETHSPTYREKLSSGEKLWPWKFGLRVILLVITIIGIGCLAWAVSHSPQFDDYNFSEDDSWALPWGLITLPCSFIWSAVCILVLLILSAYSVSGFGTGGYIQDVEPDGGEYYLAPNGTWVYNATSSYYDPYYDNPSSTTQRECDPDFSSCAAQDAYVNQLWHLMNRLVGVEYTAVACQAIAVLLHFALFVWACCDTHARNSRRTRKDAEAIAEKIIRDLKEKGELVPAVPAQRAREDPVMTVPGGVQMQEHYRSGPS
ncbi:hypothetical protein EV356DRAFT_499844 [Viridothelium virens]|uniref:Uncharacterized protein n=1 Tax=Viridothelium virens TaxID=1048519 RepID=A0A6A6HNJ2_VIRVR|nr:hypothetical protein EV356DRAFT_499844 [Viridothelium virens]